VVMLQVGSIDQLYLRRPKELSSIQTVPLKYELHNQ